MLDAWRLGLAERLRTADELPGLPDEVGQAMTALWTRSVQHARELMHQEVETERNALERNRAALDERETERAALLERAQEAKQEAQEAARRATAETTALRRLADRLEAEVKERAKDRDRILAQNRTLDTACTKLRAELRDVEAKAAKDRTARDTYIQTLEDRAHREVDRARAELKAARAELASTRKRHQTETLALQCSVDELTRALGVAEREIARQRGMVEALKLKHDAGPSTVATRRKVRRQRMAQEKT